MNRWSDSGARAGLAGRCIACLGVGRAFLGRYRDFLLAPESLATLISLALLVAATIVNPAALIGEDSPAPTADLLLLASALVGSAYIWWSALQGIREGDFTADIPVSVATAAALAIGEYAAVAIVAVLLLIGGMLEGFVAARAGRAVEALAALLPDRVTVRRGGHEQIVPLDAVSVGDLVVVRSGERIAVDGEVVVGSGLVNQAAITGESLPVEKQAGDPVFAGMLHEVGMLEVRTTNVGDDTTLGQIRRMVEAAQGEKAPIERLLDRYAKLYTPVALVLGGLLWWWSGDILRAITMLIVFCPCVMVLATPTALVASIGNAALRGSLVKKGATIESLARVDTVVFDKTGTLTFGRPRVVELVPRAAYAQLELLRMAASAERVSEHPLGRAVVEAAETRGLVLAEVEQCEVLPGLGVQAIVDGQTVLVGQPDLLDSRGVELTPESASLIADRAAPGRTVALVAVEGTLAGLLVFEDALRPEAVETARRLRSLGLRTVLVSGDNQATAKRIGREVGIDEVHGGVLPGGKGEIVRQLRAAGRAVLFVGDGVNDGPALATADVGVAMGVVGTDVAIETADIALLADDLSKLPHLLDVSRRAIRAIKQNLVFSLAVLALAVGLTIPGILHPVTGALLHELSSIPVIINSARLIGIRPRAAAEASPLQSEPASAGAV
jgi:Zn2+/Cd2+-exporting ATPase